MLEKKTRENQLIQNDVDRLRDREHALACIKILREKKCWMVTNGNICNFSLIIGTFVIDV